MAAVAVALVVVAALHAPPATAVTAVDDAGRTITFERPIRRVVTLAPSLAELVFAAGGGATLVGAVAHSDFPPAARQVERVGDATRLDVERVLALRPDLVLVWQRGATSREMALLEAAGIALFQLEPRRLDAVAAAIERLGALLGTAPAATRTAGELRASLAALRSAHVAAAPVSVFYQVWQQPLMTVSDSQLIADVIALCGGRNVFGGAGTLVPAVSIESVLAADPQVFLTAREAGGGELWRREPDAPAFAMWRRYPSLGAVRGGRLYTLDGDAIARPGPRIADGARAVCAVLDEARGELVRR